MSVNDMENKKSESEYEDTVVPAQEPDLVGRWALKGKRLVAFFAGPLWKGVSVFLAPLWKPFKKSADKVTRKDWILFSGLLLTAVLVIGTPLLWMKMKNTHHEEEEIYCFLLGERYNWEKSKFEIDKEGEVQVTDKKGMQLDVNGYPFYYTDQDLMFWPFYGIWYPVDDIICGRVERFSQIKYENGIGCSIRLPDGSERMLTGFLYDNQDTYVLMEGADLSCDGQTRRLPPFSYVRVFGNNNVDLYCYGEEKGEFFHFESDPELRFSNGTIIDLKGDIMRYPNGSRQLLFVAIEGIRPLSNE